INTLKTGDDDDTACIKVGPDASVVDGTDACLGVSRVGTNRNLPSCVASGANTLSLQGYRQKRTAGLPDSSREHVQFTAVGSGTDFFCQAQKTACFARHRRRDNHYLMTSRVPFGDAASGVLNALDRSRRGAAVFLNDQGHSLLSCLLRW